MIFSSSSSLFFGIKIFPPLIFCFLLDSDSMEEILAPLDVLGG